MNILFLHGWTSTPGGRKPTYLKDHGHTVLNPALPDDDFEAAVAIAQAECEHHHPEVIVGSSRGGAVAMNIRSQAQPLVLLCPAWKIRGKATTVKANTIILHSSADDVVPYSDSQELAANSGLFESVSLQIGALVQVGYDHRLADPEPLKAMLEAAIMLVDENVAWKKSRLFDVEDLGEVAVVRFNNLHRITLGNCLGQLEGDLLDFATHAKQDSIILDFEGRPFAPSHMFNYILMQRDRQLASGLRLCNVPQLVIEHWQFARMDGLYPTYRSLEDALK